MERAIKTRIYPTEEQKVLIEKTFGCVRFIYNELLTRQLEMRSGGIKVVSKYDMCRRITQLKKEKPWLCEIDNRAMQLSAECLEVAFKRFFKGSGFPKYKSKHGGRQSYSQNSSIRVEPHFVRVPKVGKIRTYERFDSDIIPKRIIISRKAGLYFASVQFNDGKEQSESNGNPAIGIDLGIKDLAVFSDGVKIRNPKHLKEHEKKIKHLQREVSRKTKGSNRYNKSLEKLARAYLDLANCRKDYLHKTTTMIAKSYGYIAMEGLSIYGLMQNHRMAGAIGDCGWYKFRRQLEYKCKWYGSELHLIGQFEPSSKACSNCGSIKNDLKLRTRMWTCTNCGAEHDRDINAAKNILAFSYAPMGSRKVGAEGDRKLRKQTSEETSISSEIKGEHDVVSGF